MPGFPRWLKVAIPVLLLILLGGAGWHFREQRRQAAHAADGMLGAVTQLKANWIAEWCEARLGEAAITMSSRYYSSLAPGWMQAHPTPEQTAPVLNGFRIGQSSRKYDDALFVGPAGRIYVRLSARTDELGPETRRAMESAFRKRRPVQSDLFLLPGDGSPKLDVIAPLMADAPDGSIPTGAVIFRYDALRFLKPILEFQPVHSDSFETLMVRREEASALVLNNLRFRKNTAMRLRIPSGRKDVALAAASRRTGGLQGQDYRGAEVFAAFRPAPGTRWILVSKQDKKEVYVTLYREAALVVTALFLLLASLSTALILVWQRNQKERYQALFEAETVQRRSEAHFRNTLDSMLEGCQIIDFNWRYVYLNAAVMRSIPYDRKEMLGRPITEIFPDIEKTDRYAAFKRCMEERTVEHIEARVQLSGQQIHWYDMSIQPVPEGIFVLTIDITDRKRAEEALRDSETRYRSLFERMTQGVFVRRADGSIADVNPATLKIFGVTKAEFIERGTRLDWDLVWEDGEPMTEEDFPSVAALKIGKPVSAVVGIWNDRARSHSWVEISAIPEFESEGEQPTEVMVTLRDITDRRQVELEHARLASAIAQSSDIVVIIDTDKIVRYVNPAFTALTGFSPEEAIGRPLPLNETQNEEFYRQFWETLDSGKTWKGRLVNRNKKGELYSEEASVSPVFNKAGAIVNYVSVARNVTEYLKLQEEKDKLQEQFLQSQKMESIGRLAGGVAHDFNNMLSVISGHAQLGLETVTPQDPLYVNLLEIDKAALRSADLTRQLLAFARKQTIAPKVLSLNNTVGGLLSMLQRLIGEDIDLAWMPGRDLWQIKVDPAQVDQILANLAVNARDAIEKHGKITIETENVSFDEEYCASHQGCTPGEYVMLALSDDGCGMDKAVQEHLFEPFFTTKRTGKGTGLGLATVYGIVKQNRGSINVYSEPGRGSTFKVHFPRHVGADAAEPTLAASEAPQGGVETILLVEDELSVLNLTRIMLQRLGYNVIATTSPREALRLAADHPGGIDLLLVDVVMPEMTGRDLSEQLRPIRPEMGRLFMSGYTANVIAHHGVLDEDVHFVQKPFSTKELAAKVREALERKTSAAD